MSAKRTDWLGRPSVVVNLKIHGEVAVSRSTSLPGAATVENADGGVALAA